MLTTTRRRSLLRHLDVALLWSAGLASWIGIYAMFVALPVLVYARSGSTMATALTVLAGALPTVLVGQVAGVVADRVDRRRLMVAVNMTLGVLTLGYLLVGEGEWWQLAVLSFAISSTGQFVGPAEHALLPELVERDRLGEAASLNALNNNLARLAGPGLGGVLLARGGWDAVVLLTAATYGLAAVLVWLVRAARPDSPPPAGRRPLHRDWLEGAATVWRDPHLRGLLAVLALVMLGEGFVSALLAPLVSDVVGGGAETLGWILSAQAVGGVAGATWATRLTDRIDPVRLLGLSAVTVAGLLVVAFNYALLYPRVWPAIVLTGIAGVPFAIYASAQLQALQLQSTPHQRGRVFGLSWGLNGLTQLVGILLAGGLAERWGALVINADAAAYLLGGACALFLSRRSRRIGAHGETSHQ